MSPKDPDPIAAPGPPADPYAALVGIVRLLARQAARKVISSSSVVDAGSRISHDNGGPADV